MGRKRPTAACALCEQVRPLCQSHILPEFLYARIYDEEPRRFYATSTEENTRPEIMQKGIREYLLCRECEDLLNPWETYAKDILYDRASLVQTSDGRVYAEGVDYETFKLFQMSVLWRASVAQKPFFAEVKLGPHEERLRQMLLKSDPGKETQYGCMLIQLMRHRAVASRSILSPETVKIMGYWVGRFHVAGWFWLFYLSSHVPWQAKNYRPFMRTDGRLPLHRDTGAAARYFEQWGMRVAESGNANLLPPAPEA